MKGAREDTLTIDSEYEPMRTPEAQLSSTGSPASRRIKVGRGGKMEDDGRGNRNVGLVS